MKLMRIGGDLAKNVFQIHGVDCHEQPIRRQRLPRDRWLQTVLEKIGLGCEIGMESSSGAHHWVRQLQARGFQVRLIAPQFAKPYVKSNKNDANDAEAICEAMSRPSMRFVVVKTIEQQDIQATHRIRAGLIEQRTGCVADYDRHVPC
jgi:transposase